MRRQCCPSSSATASPNPLKPIEKTTPWGNSTRFDPFGQLLPHSYPRTRLAGGGSGRSAADRIRSQDAEKPAGYQRVSGQFRTVSERSGRAKKGHLVTRRVTQPLASMRVSGHKIGLLPTLLPTSAFWGWMGVVWGPQARPGRTAGVPPARSPALLRTHSAPPSTGPALRWAFP